jgi:hypothetical protein
MSSKNPPPEASPVGNTEASGSDSHLDGPVAHELHFFTPKLSKSMRISTTSGDAPASNALYYAKVTRLKTYDVELYRGGDDTGKCIGAARIRHSLTFHLCYGDPDDHTAHWADLKNQKIWTVHYAMEVPGTDGVKTYVWRHTKNDESIKRSRKALWNWKLVEQDSDEVIAVYLPDWRRNGILRFRTQVDKVLEVWAVLSVVSLVTKAR